MRPDRLRRFGVLRARVGEHQALDEFGMQNPQTLSDHAAHRQADKHDRAVAPFPYQTRGVIDQFDHGVRPRGHGRATVAAMVVAQHRVALRGESRGQLVPQVQVHPEPMAQHDRGTSAV